MQKRNKGIGKEEIQLCLKMTGLPTYKIPRNLPKNPPPGTNKAFQQSHRVQTQQAHKIQKSVVFPYMTMWTPKLKIQ